MAKVYTMEELERARKKAQIREWFQDKKVKAQTWCYEHKEQIITYGPVVVGGIAAGAKMPNTGKMRMPRKFSALMLLT